MASSRCEEAPSGYGHWHAPTGCARGTRGSAPDGDSSSNSFDGRQPAVSQPHPSCRLQRRPMDVAATASMAATAAAVLATLHGTLVAGAAAVGHCCRYGIPVHLLVICTVYVNICFGMPWVPPRLFIPMSFTSTVALWLSTMSTAAPALVPCTCAASREISTSRSATDAQHASTTALHVLDGLPLILLG